MVWGPSILPLLPLFFGAIQDRYRDDTTRLDRLAEDILLLGRVRSFPELVAEGARVLNVDGADVDPSRRDCLAYQLADDEQFATFRDGVSLGLAAAYMFDFPVEFTWGRLPGARDDFFAVEHVVDNLNDVVHVVVTTAAVEAVSA